jgi:hypothetical protein
MTRLILEAGYVTVSDMDIELLCVPWTIYVHNNKHVACALRIVVSHSTKAIVRMVCISEGAAFMLVNMM